MTLKTRSTGVTPQGKDLDVRGLMSGQQQECKGEHSGHTSLYDVSDQSGMGVMQQMLFRLKHLLHTINWKAILKFFLSVTEISSLFQYCPAIFCGLIAGLFFVNWLDGLNAGATVIVFILSICLCEVIWQALRRPHIILGACVGGVVIIWLEDLNMGAEIIIFLSCIACADLLHQAMRKAGKKLEMQ